MSYSGFYRPAAILMQRQSAALRKYGYAPRAAKRPGYRRILTDEQRREAGCIAGHASVLMKVST